MSFCVSKNRVSSRTDCIDSSTARSLMIQAWRNGCSPYLYPTKLWGTCSSYSAKFVLLSHVTWRAFVLDLVIRFTSFLAGSERSLWPEYSPPRTGATAGFEV